MINYLELALLWFMFIPFFGWFCLFILMTGSDAIETWKSAERMRVYHNTDDLFVLIGSDDPRYKNDD